jgi:hypothetical protein
MNPPDEVTKTPPFIQGRYDHSQFAYWPIHHVYEVSLITVSALKLRVSANNNNFDLGPGRPDAPIIHILICELVPTAIEHFSINSVKLSPYTRCDIEHYTEWTKAILSGKG